MSRIGKQEIVVPSDIKVDLKPGSVSISKGNHHLERTFPPEIMFSIKDNKITVTRKNDERKSRALHGLFAKLVANMVAGLQKPFTKVLSIHGIGFKGQVTGKKLVLTVGYSHTVDFPIPENITVVVDQKSNNIMISGFDKQMVGQVAANIREIRLPEPYKGTGIRYADEKIRRKAGKAAATAGAGAGASGGKK